MSSSSIRGPTDPDSDKPEGDKPAALGTAAALGTDAHTAPPL